MWFSLGQVFWLLLFGYVGVVDLVVALTCGRFGELGFVMM